MATGRTITVMPIVSNTLGEFWPKISLFIRAIATAAMLAFALPPDWAWSQTGRTIKIVVPFPAGGSSDTLARVLADQISRAQGTTMVVENRPGATSVIGTEAASRAVPDGNTLLIVANSFVINPNFKKLSYDPLTSFEPICCLVRSPQVIAVNRASPYSTLAELFNAARAKPGTLTLASVGPASTQQIAFDMLKRAANVDMTHIPYSGNAPAVNALLGGQVTSVLVNYSEVFEHVGAGNLRALATSSRSRIDSLPDVPTVAESGYDNYEAEVWFGLVAPANTPKETVSRLASWFTAAMQAPDVNAKLVALKLYPVGTCGADFAAHLRKQYDEYARVIRELNIKGE
jgi:tripartite-type tricarboxylate transporter receptor subunit TctC